MKRKRNDRRNNSDSTYGELAAIQALKTCEAKEKFTKELKNSGLEYCVIRPNGFFSDMTEFYTLAKNRRIYLSGNGKLKSNPIHGEDLAPEYGTRKLRDYYNSLSTEKTYNEKG